jgi:hypothetical protein
MKPSPLEQLIENEKLAKKAQEIDRSLREEAERQNIARFVEKVERIDQRVTTTRRLTIAIIVMSLAHITLTILSLFGLM